MESWLLVEEHTPTLPKGANCTRVIIAWLKPDGNLASAPAMYHRRYGYIWGFMPMDCLDRPVPVEHPIYWQPWPLPPELPKAAPLLDYLEKVK